MEPGEGALDIGDGHAIRFAEYKGERAGITQWHRKPNGEWCCGWVAFKGAAWERGFREAGTPITAWDVVQADPLTLAPSLKCRACGDHGFIRGGRWVRA